MGKIKMGLGEPKKNEESVAVINEPKPTIIHQILDCSCDLSPFITKEQLPSLIPIEEKISTLSKKYDIILNRQNDLNDQYLDQLDKLLIKSLKIENKIDRNLNNLEIELKNIHDEMNINKKIFEKEFDLLNESILNHKHETNKFMPYVQIAAAVLLSILLIKIF